MFTSQEISERTQKPIQGYSYGFGPMGSPQWRGDAGFMGATPWGPGAGDAFATGTLGGITSAVNFSQTVGMVGGLASTLGVGPSWMGNLGKLAGFGMGLGPQAAIFAGVQALNYSNRGLQDQIRINEITSNQLGDRVGMGGRGGLGISRAGMQQVGDMVREMRTLPEMMTSVGELTGLMEKMGQAGMLQGARSLADFKNKFKQNISALRDMSKVLGSTMEEALSITTELQGMGITSAKDRLKAAINRQATSMMGIGVSSELVGQVQAGGAQMAGAFGNRSRTAGVAGATNILQTLSVASQMGVIDEQRVADLTGATGEQGIAALTSMSQDRITRMMMESGLGQAMAAAAGEVNKEGKFTGGLDMGIIEKFKSGTLSKEELMKIASRKLSGEGATASFSRYKSGLSFKAAQSMGVEGVLNQIQRMSEELGQKDEDLVAIVAKNFLGGDQTLADTLLNVAKNMSGIELEKKRQYRQAIEAKVTQAVYKKDYTIGGKFDQLTNRLSSMIAAPIEAVGAEFAYAAGGIGDTVVDTLFGLQPAVQFTETDLFRARRGIQAGKYGDTALNPMTRQRMSRTAFANMTEAEKKAMAPILGAQNFKYRELAQSLNAQETNAGKMEIFRSYVDSRLGSYQPNLRRYGEGGDQVYAAAAEMLTQQFGADSAFAQIMPSIGGGLIGPKVSEEDLIGDLVDSSALFDYTGQFNDETLSPFLKEHSKVSEEWLKAFTSGKVGGIAVEDFLMKNKGFQMGVLKALGLDDTEAGELLKRLGDSEFLANRTDEESQKAAKGLLAARETGAATLVQQDLQMAIGELMYRTPEQATAVESFAKGDSAALYKLLGGKQELGSETLKTARTAVQSVEGLSKRFKGTQEDFIAQLGLPAQDEQVMALIDKDSTLSVEERQKLTELAKTNRVFQALAPSTSTGTFGGRTREEVRDESLRLMVAANTDFVATVAGAVGNDKMKEAADKVKANSVFK
jgi:hypothetical protein